MGNSKVSFTLNFNCSLQPMLLQNGSGSHSQKLVKLAPHRKLYYGTCTIFPDCTRYTQVFNEALPVDECDTPKPQRRPRPKQMCFNCAGEHNLSDCKEPRDHRKIAENRTQFNIERSKSSQSLAKNARYIEDPRFAKFKPGVISDDLRIALGLSSRQLPSFVYQMRLFGYPPGHLEAAKTQTSGLSLFGKDGKEVGLDDEVLEDGEVDMNKIPKVHYDFDKLIDFPGYNVEPPDNTIDDGMRFGVPPMMPQHSKAVLQLYLTPQTSKSSSKRQHSDIGRANHKKKKQRRGNGEDESVDMELDESADEGQFSQDSTADSASSSKQTSREGSPTLDDLEQAKRNLQQRLQRSSTDSDSFEPLVLDSCGEEVQSQDSETEGNFLPPLPPTPVRPPLPENTPPATPPVSRLGSQSPFIPGVQSPLVGAGSPSNSGFKPPLPPETPPSGTPPQTPPVATPGSVKSIGLSTPVTPQGANISQLIQTPSTGGSVSMTFGTPVSEGAVTKDKGLPDASKFASNIEDDIPFENLPNATGTFKRMKKVLDFLRSKKASS